MNTQCQRILLHFAENKKLSSLDALSQLGICRLASRIYDLSKQGYIFDRKKKIIKNRYNKTCYITEYILIKRGIYEPRRT